MIEVEFHIKKMCIISIALLFPLKPKKRAVSSSFSDFCGNYATNLKNLKERKAAFYFSLFLYPG